MKQYAKAVAVQATSIIITALIAAAITFLQTLLKQMGAEAVPEATPESAGILGGSIKLAHTLYRANHGII